MYRELCIDNMRESERLIPERLHATVDTVYVRRGVRRDENAAAYGVSDYGAMESTQFLYPESGRGVALSSKYVERFCTGLERDWQTRRRLCSC